jgi:hypothetical protein
MKWQPIETAPRDGITVVDIWIVDRKTGDGRRHANCRWYSDGGGWHGWMGSDGLYRTDEQSVIATHWLRVEPPREDFS